MVMFSCKHFDNSFYIAWSYVFKAVNYISSIIARFLVELVLMREVIQRMGLYVVVYILNFIEEIIVESFYNSTLITAGLLTFLTMEKAVEVFSETFKTNLFNLIDAYVLEFLKLFNIPVLVNLMEHSPIVIQYKL